MIFSTQVEHSPIKSYLHKVLYGNARAYTHTAMNSNVHDTDQYHTCVRRHTLIMASSNWVLILVGAEILWEVKGFQFGFKGWPGWTVSKVLWEWIQWERQQKCKSRDGHPGLPVPNSPYGLCGRKATSNLTEGLEKPWPKTGENEIAEWHDIMSCLISSVTVYDRRSL